MIERDIKIYNILLESVFPEEKRISGELFSLNDNASEEEINQHIGHNSTTIIKYSNVLEKACIELKKEIQKKNIEAEKLNLSTTNPVELYRRRTNAIKHRIILQGHMLISAIHEIINFENFLCLLEELETVKNNVVKDIVREKRYFHQYNLSKKLAILSITIGVLSIFFGLIFIFI